MIQSRNIMAMSRCVLQAWAISIAALGTLGTLGTLMLRPGFDVNTIAARGGRTLPSC